MIRGKAREKNNKDEMKDKEKTNFSIIRLNIYSYKKLIKS